MRRFSLVFLIILVPAGIFAQDDLMDLLNDSTVNTINYTSATFKSTRIMNGHSVEKMPPGQLDVRISHRFGRVNTGPYEFFGLDQANIHLSLEYGIFKWLMVGAGRGTYEKTYDGFAKFTLLRQSDGAKQMPVSVSLFSSVAVNSLKWSDPERTNYFSSRLSYVGQVLVARKFNQMFSAQITPSYVHRNMVATELDPNDLFAIGAGGRMKLSKRISINAEYYYVANPKTYISQSIYNPLSIGVDIETGGHVFQLILTNSVAMIEKGFIGETTGQWKEGDIHFGFNISRVFTLKKHKAVG
ncbi:MAG: hypothetical protein IPJ37_15930 [Bacteroidales bacterium]|nr:hypothetical protein [Bacteroidales bacterium]